MKRYTTDNTSVVVVDLKGRAYWAEPDKKKPGNKLFSFFGKK